MIASTSKNVKTIIKAMATAEGWKKTIVAMIATTSKKIKTIVKNNGQDRKQRKNNRSNALPYIKRR